MKRIKVLIPFFKDTSKLERCLKHLNSSAFKDFETATNDDTETKLGFTASVNTLLKSSLLSGHEFFLILNQDCYLAPEALGEMVAFMERNPNCAFVGCKQTMEDGDRITHGGTGACFPSGVHEGGSVKKGDCNRSKLVPWVNGACFMARVEAVLEIGIMDKNFKMFGSDSDWSYRARLAGWTCGYAAKATCVHEQGISKQGDKATSTIIEKDMRYFRDKWLVGEVYRDLSLEVFK
jgi:GT2 family glycosyltransferase